MSEWKAIPQQRQHIGGYIVDYLRNPDRHGEGGHQVTFPDGKRLRVLPDGRTTTKRRNHTILSGLTHLNDIDAEQPEDSSDPTLGPIPYIVGLLVLDGADSWEIADEPISPEQVIAECIADWNPNVTASKILAELEASGLAIVRREG